MFGEVKVFGHLELKKHTYGRAGTSERLSKVYSKLQAWNLDTSDIEVAILLDTDIWVKSNLDDLFSNLEYGDCGGVFRGNANFPLTEPRPAASIKTKENRAEGASMAGSWFSSQIAHCTVRC